MHSAASVIYPVARSRRVGWLMSVIWIAGLLPVAGGIWQVQAPVLLKCAMAVGSIGIGIGCLHSWWQEKPDFLAWDGQTWRNRTNPEAGVSVVLDFQSLMLLRFTPCAGRALWMFVDRRAAPAIWHGLRCAIVASAFPATDVSDPVAAG